MSKQQKLLNQFEELSNENRFPHSIILIGPEYSDQEEVLEKIAELENLEIVEYDPDFNYNDTILKLLVNIKTEDLKEPNQIKLLKEFEEPKENVYYVINSPFEEFILEPLKNRGKIFYLEKYSKREIKEAITKKDYEKQLLFCCHSPKMVEQVEAYIEQAVKLVNQFVENYRTAPITEYLKLIDFFDFDNDKTKVNPLIFIGLLQGRFMYQGKMSIAEKIANYKINYSINRQKKHYMEAMLLDIRGF